MQREGGRMGGSRDVSEAVDPGPLGQHPVLAGRILRNSDTVVSLIELGARATVCRGNGGAENLKT